MTLHSKKVPLKDNVCTKSKDKELRDSFGLTLAAEIVSKKDIDKSQ
jgi:hypothetical protein